MKKKKKEKVVLQPANNPANLMKSVPWDSVNGCILIYQKDGIAHIHVTDMPWKDRMWLSQEITNLNASDMTIQRIQMSQQQGVKK